MNTYTHSTAVAKLQQAREQQQPLRLAFLDVDGTWAGPPKEQQAVHDLLEANQYVITAVTNRASQLCFDLNADILAASFGTELLVKQTDGTYQPDEQYARRLPSSPHAWQIDAQTFLSRHATPSQPLATLHMGQPIFRLEAQLPTSHAAQAFLDKLRQDDRASSLHLARDNATVVLTPARTSKEDAVDHVVTTLTRELNGSPVDFHVLLAGDSMADLPMGLYAAAGTHATFLIPGGASLAHELKMTKTEKDDTLRAVVIGDETFPGTAGPATLIAWLRQEHS